VDFPLFVGEGLKPSGRGAREKRQDCHPRVGWSKENKKKPRLRLLCPLVKGMGGITLANGGKKDMDKGVRGKRGG